MIKAVSAILLLGLAVLANAEPLRQRFVPRRGLARQEQEALPNAAPTGYPAAGITPDVPFELPSSTVQPEVSYLPPDNTYGPPADAAPQPDEEPLPETDDLPVPEDDQTRQLPAPDADEDEVLVQVAEDGTVISVSTSLDQPAQDGSKSARFYQRFPQSGRGQQPVPQRLVRFKL
ncbi:uncharacterized protein LOC6558142 [Drosophila grimshawi]|uniref:GH15095 n=1 Tax=Drosophila grimshawi TaxID=7222 RepID=B4IYV2_DROGR|nr:uncharacterized protein LOC6558142 [Drosophila grimshawi]EDV96639.1 GH15095 [Drosophila grimshawi]